MGKLVFAQVTEHLPLKVFHRCVKHYNGNHKVKSFSCLDQFLCMAFAQLTYRESLRGTEIWLRAQSEKLYQVYKRRYSHPVSSAARSSGVKCNQTVVLTGVNAKIDYPQPLRRVKYHDSETGKTFNFLTNNFTIPAQTVAELYRYRWQVELFFKWIKQHLRIKSFFGTTENAVKSQIWIAISVYVLVAIIKKRLKLETELYTILQIFSLTLFEKTPLDQLLMKSDCKSEECTMDNQLNLLDLTLGH